MSGTAGRRIASSILNFFYPLTVDDSVEPTAPSFTTPEDTGSNVVKSKKQQSDPNIMSIDVKKLKSFLSESKSFQEESLAEQVSIITLKLLDLKNQAQISESFLENASKRVQENKLVRDLEAAISVKPNNQTSSAKPSFPPPSKEKHPLDTDEPFFISDQEKAEMIRTKDEFKKLASSRKDPSRISCPDIAASQYFSHYTQSFL